MRVYTLSIKPLEPLMFKGAGEFDPSSRGVYSYAMSMNIPRPSTVIGALLSLLSSSSNIASWSDLLSNYNEILDSLGIEAMRGPYVLRKNKIYVPLSLKEPLLVEYYQLRKFLLDPIHGDVLNKLLAYNYEDLEKALCRLRYIEKKIREYSLELKDHWYTGIHIEDRDSGIKRVKENYIYTVKYVVYPEDTEIRFKLVIRDEGARKKVLERLVNRTIPVKLGGEHRVAEVILQEERSCDDVNEILESTKFKYALLLSPMPLDTKSLQLVNYVGACGVIGLGYSLAKNKRKPMYSALLEGSIVCLGDSHKELDLNNLLKYGLYAPLNMIRHDDYRVLGRLGYASYIPLDPR